ncbi:hypothetical protein N5P37_011749 [Trichoderma harzianum]|nr:hypothetical protein N5P37_011749 [Trichoderma harzianum]
MVYRGRLSSACKLCRAKRRKCDETRPSCSQCTRAGAVCSDYRDLSLLQVHDETATVAQKAHTRKRLSHRLDSALQPCSVNPTAEDSKSESSYDRQEFTAISQLSEELGSSITISLSSDIEGLAFSFFMNSPIALNSFSYLPKHWKSLELCDNLHSCVKAVSLAMLCFELKRPVILRVAKKYYIEGLASTNRALTSTQEAVLDTTLLSVLLLSTFEAAIFWEHRSPTAWTAHVQGSSLLLQLRGRQEMQTRLGQDLFVHTSTNIRLSCIQNSLPIPSNFTVLNALVAIDANQCNLSSQLGLLWDRFVSLRTWADGKEDMDALISWIELGQEIDGLLHRMHTVSPYNSAGTHNFHIMTYKGMGRQYPSHTVACQWNVLRIFRLSVKEAAASTYSALRATRSNSPNRTEAIHVTWVPEHLTQSTDTVALIDEVLASMAFMLANLEALSLHSVRSMMWSLVGVSRSTFAPEPARIYSKAILNVLRAHFLSPNTPFTASETEWPLVGHDCLAHNE